MTVNGQNENGDRDTNYDAVLTAMNQLIPTPGTGLGSSPPQKVLFFVSDGVADEPDPGSCSQPLTGNRWQEPVNLALCTAIKNRGIKIAVLYTRYLQLPFSGSGSNSWFNTWILPFWSNISPTMQSCASPGLFFEVSPTQGISQAMSALFQKVVATVHLAQ
jgi:hypothetical protein